MPQVRATHTSLPRAKEMRVYNVATNEELRPSNRPAHAGSPWLLPFLGLVAIAAALTLVTLGRHAEHEAHTPARFLNDSLGEERAAPLAPVQAGNATARIDAGRLVVQGPQRDRVALEALVGGVPGWQRHAGGEWRATPFGSEAITLGTVDPEHFLTVDRRVGAKTWEWKLETTLVARLLSNGGVGFVDPVSRRVSDLTIAPVAIFDAGGKDVTPAGARWELGRGGTLKLNLNDQELPEPYVIDPAFRSIGTVAASAAANTVAPAVPAGVLVGDQLVAFVSVNAPTATFTVVPPAGWTVIRNERQTTNVALWTFRKQATASEPGPYTFTFQDPTGTNVNKTSRAVVAAYSGIQSSAPIDGSFGNNGGSNRTANVTNVSTTGTNRISIWTVGNNVTRTATNPLINGVATTERIDSITAAPALELADALEPTAFGPVTVGTGNVLSGNAFWAAQVFSLIPDTTAPTQTLNLNEGTNPGGQFYNSTTKTHYYNTAAGGTFTVGSVPVDADSGVTSVAFNAVALTGFTHTLVTDTTSPYASGTYTWTTANTTSPGANRVTVTDRNANALNELTVTRDVTQPAAFTLNAPTGGAFIKNGSTVSVAGGSPTDAGAGITNVAFRACPGSNGCTWADGDAFAVGSDTTDQYAATWPAGQSDGAYQLIARATDNVGNLRDTAAPVNVTLDNTNPTQTLALASVSQSGGLDQAFKNGNTVYYGGATAGSFRVRSSVSDGGSGPASATFAALGGTTTGWTFTGSTSTTPGAGAYDSNNYSWANGTTSSPTADVAPTDAVGNTGAAGTLTFTNDSTAPTHAFTSPAAAGNYNAAGWSGSITGSASDGGADLLRVDVAIQQGSGNYYDGNSFANGSLTWLTATGTTSWSYAIAAAKLTSGNVYTISLRAIDNVGNTAATITRTFTYDTAAPTFGTLAVGSPTNASVTGTTVYFRSGVAGSFTLSQPLSDSGGSGAASVQFPAIATTGWTHGNETVNGASPYVSSTFSWSASPSTPSGYTLTGADNAGNSATQGLTFVDDSTAPTGALTVNGTAATGGGSTSTSDGSFTILRTDYTDAASGIATSTLTRDAAPFSNDGCGTYSGSPTTLVGAPAQILGAGCYEYVLTGTDAVGNAVSIRTVVQVHGAATQIDLTGSTANLTSGASRVLTATLRDAAGNTVLSDSSTVVAFGKASGAGTVTGTGNATASNGLATKTVTGALAGSVTMEATSAGLTTGTLGAFTIVHGAATQIALTGSTADLAAGSTRVLTATIQDATGNTVTSDSSTVVAFAQQSGAGTVSGTGSATASSGVATKTVTGVLAGAATMEATSAGLTTGTLGAFTVVHGAAAQIVLTGSTADLASGSNRVLTATIQDAAGNTVTSDSSTVVAFAQASGAGTVTGTGNATASSGVATKSVTGALVGSVTMEATSAGLTTGTLGSFTVVHGPSADIVLTGSTADLASGATRVLTATLKDAAGNTVTSDNATIVAFAKASGAGTVTGTGTATASSGVATKTITGALVGSVTIEATSAGLTTGTLGAFTVVHGAAAQILLTGSTADLASGATRVLTATIQDAAGNTATSDNSTVVAFAQASGAGTVTGTGNATASGGIATKTITGALVGSVTMETTATGLTTGTLGAFTVVHGPSADIVLTGSTADLTSGATRVLTATIRDAAGNTVTADNSTIVSFAKASGAGTVTGTGNATASGGVATKTITGALAGPVVMEATATGLTTGTLGAFTVVHGAATQIALAGSTADLTSGSNRVLTATVQDAAGNTITADNSTVVSFSKQSGAGTVAGTGTATASNGVATKTITGQVVGSVTMQATASGLTTGTLGAFTVVHGSAVRVALSGSLSDLVSGTNRILTATIQDAAGNTITSDSSTVVTFSKASGAGTVTGTGTATASNGVATKTITGQLVGAVTMEATAVGLTTGTLLPFSVVHGPAAQIQLTGSTADLTSGANRVLTAILRDAAGNLATGDNSTVVAFAKASGAGTVTGTGNATASGGGATKTITGALVGSVTMEATAAGLTTGTLGAFTVVHGAAIQVALTGATTDLVSGANRVLTATVQDAAGNTITSDNSTSISFAQVGGAGTVTGLAGAEGVTAGVATKTVTGELAGSVDLEATASGLTAGTLEFDVVHGAANKVTVSASLADLVSGTTRVLTATVRDVAGNRVASDNSTVVTFAKDSGAGTVTGLGSDTAAAGVASKTVTGQLAGAITIQAGAPGLVADNISFDVVHGAAASIDLTGSTADLTFGSNRVLTATIRDAAGNTVTSDSSTVIAFAKASGAGTVSGTGNATAASGVATKTITGQLVGAVTMEATSAGLSSGSLGAFTVVHGAAASIDLTGSTADLTSGANRLLTATVKDAAGNTVTSDNSTVVAFAKASGAGTVTGNGNATAANGVATKTDHRRARRPGHDGSHRGRTHHRHARRLHRRPRRRLPDRADPLRLDRLRRQPHADRDDPRRRRQHRHRRRLDRRRLREDRWGRHRHGAWQRDRFQRGRDQGRRQRRVRPDRPRRAGRRARDRDDELHDHGRQRLDAGEHDLGRPHLDRRQRLEHERDHRPAQRRRRQRSHRLGRHRRTRPDRRRLALGRDRQRRRHVLGDAHLPYQRRQCHCHGHAQRRRARRHGRRYVHPRACDRDHAGRERLDRRRERAHAHRDDQGCEREHGHERQLDGRRVREDRRRRHRHRPWQRHRLERRRGDERHQHARRPDRSRRAGVRTHGRDDELHDHGRPRQRRRIRLDRRRHADDRLRERHRLGHDHGHAPRRGRQRHRGQDRHARTGLRQLDDLGRRQHERLRRRHLLGDERDRRDGHIHRHRHDRLDHAPRRRCRRLHLRGRHRRRRTRSRSAKRHARLAERHDALLQRHRRRLVHALERGRRRRLGPGLRCLSGRDPARLDARRRDGLDPGRRPVRLGHLLVQRRLERRLHPRRHRQRRLDAAEHERDDAERDGGLDGAGGEHPLQCGCLLGRLVRRLARLGHARRS